MRIKTHSNNELVKRLHACGERVIELEFKLWKAGKSDTNLIQFEDRASVIAEIEKGVNK